MLWDDFLNSDYHDWRGGDRTEDRLERPGWAEKLLAEYRINVSAPPSPGELAAMKKMRERLLGFVRALVDGSGPESEWISYLNELMASGAVVRRIDAEDARLAIRSVPVGDGWPQAIAEVAASFASMLVDNEPDRIRICDNPDCLWVYYDDTRNRSKRYCDDKMCGNLMKVRRFRARRKAAAALPPEEQ